MKNSTAYQAALNGAAYFHQQKAGFLRLGGDDRVDFIQRQSTNDLRALTPNQSVMTVLTSPTARILDVICVIDMGESLGMIPLPGRSEETAKFLRSRIFFSDQVEVTDISSNFMQVLVVGPQSTMILENLGVQLPKLGQVSTVNLSDQSVIVISQIILAEVNYLLLVPSLSMDSVLSVLAKAGVESLDSETFEILRVESGQPGPAGELKEDYTPLEIGYKDMISESKGCYTGQEIIARQITYDKISKYLVGMKLNHYVDVGSTLIAGAKSVGTLTSVVQSPRFGVIGLGVVRRQFCDPGMKLTIYGASGAGIIVEVSKFPFA